MQKSESYLNFDMSQMVNLDYSLGRELIRANDKGAYYCTTLVECNTRKQHGLLVMPIPEFNNSQHVLLSALDETVIQHGAEFNLGLHKYDANNYSPLGHKYIREFNYDFLPKTIYRVGGVILQKERMFSYLENAVYLRYTLLDVHSPTTIRFKPYLAFREINQLTYENNQINATYNHYENGISSSLYQGYPDLYMQFSKSAKFVSQPVWNKGVEYKKDMENGYPYKEDLYIPGYFEVPIKKGEQIIFVAGCRKMNATEVSESYQEALKHKRVHSSFEGCLADSGSQFHYKPHNGKHYLIDSYPCRSINFRNQFMALPGLTLAVDRIADFEEILDTAIPDIKAFIKNPTKAKYVTDLSGIDDPDVLFWLTRALQIYAQQPKNKFSEKYADLVLSIANFIMTDKHPRLKLVKESSLLYTDGRTRPASWMNFIKDGLPAVPRTGCLVEINAFWFDMLMFVSEIAALKRNVNLEKKTAELAEKVRQSFTSQFFNSGGYLYDYIDGEYKDLAVRPNMLLAIATFAPILNKRQTKSVLDVVTKELLTTKGIRSLSPKSFGFRPRIEGDMVERRVCTFNGGAWPWLFDAYFHAYFKIFQNSGISFLDRLLIGLEEEIKNDCIGSLSEVYDSGFPYRGHGAIAYSVNIAGVLRACAFQKAIEKQLEN